MDIQEIIEWFKAAKPKPTTDDIAVQIGCHFEEIAEMQEALAQAAAVYEGEIVAKVPVLYGVSFFKRFFKR